MVTLGRFKTNDRSGGEGNDKPGIPGINYKLKTTGLVSNSAEYADKFLAGGNSNLPFVSKITGHPMGMYVDPQRIIKFAGSMVKMALRTNCSMTHH
jgi:hypothetical protein